MSLTPEPSSTGGGTVPPQPGADVGPVAAQPVTDMGPLTPHQGPEVSQAPHMRATWSGVTVSWQGRWLFKDFTYSVPDGGIVGLVGARGASMDAALLALAGRYPLDSGNVVIVDAPDTVVVAHLDSQQLDDPLLTVRETVAQTARASSPTTNEANVVRCIAAVGLQEIADAQVGSLTMMQRTRVALAAAAATGANVIALNASGAAGEPDEDELWQLLAQLAGTGRLVLASNPRPHQAMDLVLTIPHGLEVPA